MIDTDKYEANAHVWFLETHEEYQNARVEGFISAEWEFNDYLLAEVKRLREELRLTKEWLDQLYDEELMSAFRFHVYGINDDGDD